MRLDDYDAEILAEHLNGKLIRKIKDCLEISISGYGIVSLHENGGEVNVSFEYLLGFKTQLPNGVRIAEFALDFSVNYNASFEQKNCAVTEFANRLNFCLERASTGVSLIDYYQQGKLPEAQPFMPTLGGEILPKIECDISRYFPNGTNWSIQINSDYEFEVRAKWEKNQTLLGTYKIFKNALKSIGINS